MNKLISKFQTSIKFVWSQIVAYPKSVFLYFMTIYIGLFTKCSKFIVEFGYDVGWWIFIPFVLIICLLIYAKKLNGKNFFINTSFSIFILYGILFCLFYKNTIDSFLFLRSLCLYILYHAVFSLLYILFSLQNSPKEKIPYIQQFYYIFLATVILIIYYLLVATPLLSHITNRQETINTSSTVFNYLWYHS